MFISLSFPAFWLVCVCGGGGADIRAFENGNCFRAFSVRVHKDHKLG